jgi:hypothetical protein
MDLATSREVTEVIVAGMSKGEFIAVLFLGGILIAVLMWYLQRLVAPLRDSLKETSNDIKTILPMIKTDEEIKEVVKNTVYEHVFACEGKKILPKVLDVLERNSQTIDKHSQSNHELATAINNLNNHGARL